MTNHPYFSGRDSMSYNKKVPENFGDLFKLFDVKLKLFQHQHLRQLI